MKRIILLAIIVFNTFGLIRAQPNFTGQCLRIGRQFGSTSFANAFTATSRTNTNDYTIYKDKIKNNRWDINYSRRSEHVLFDMQIDGALQSLINYATNKDLQYKPLKNMLVKFPVANGFTSSVSKNSLNATGVDNTLIDFNFCLGTKNIYAGYHLRYYELFTEARYTNDNYFVEGNDKYGDASTSSGLSFHYVRNYVNKIKVHHMLSYDFMNGKKGFDGNVITTQHTVYWGKNQFGLYASPYFSIRYGGNAGFSKDVYGINHSANTTKSIAIGIKIGIYLTNGDEEKNRGGYGSISSGRNGGSSINNSSSHTTGRSENSICNSCNGKGTLMCTRCGGSGTILQNAGPETQKCNVCNGNGYTTCMVCGGKGKK